MRKGKRNDWFQHLWLFEILKFNSIWFNSDNIEQNVLITFFYSSKFRGVITTITIINSDLDESFNAVVDISYVMRYITRFQSKFKCHVPEHSTNWWAKTCIVYNCSSYALTKINIVLFFRTTWRFELWHGISVF